MQCGAECTSAGIDAAAAAVAIHLQTGKRRCSDNVDTHSHLRGAEHQVVGCGIFLVYELLLHLADGRAEGRSFGSAASAGGTSGGAGGGSERPSCMHAVPHATMPLKVTLDTRLALIACPIAAPPPCARACLLAAAHAHSEHMHGVLGSPWLRPAAAKLSSARQGARFRAGRPTVRLCPRSLQLRLQSGWAA